MRTPFVTPTSYVVACARYQRIVMDIARVNNQLDDLERESFAESPREYRSWRARAIIARSHMHEDRELLLQWLENNEPLLLRNAHGLLHKLAIKEGLEMEKEEMSVVDDLIAYFAITAKMAS